jgi:restriction system protein
MNIFLKVLAILFILLVLGAIGEYLEQGKRKKLTIGQLLYQIKIMNSREFEFFCAKLFELQGYKAKVTKATGDGGKDVILWKGKTKYYVECKHYNADGKVSRPIANKLYGTMCADGVERGIIITTGRFTKECVEWCKMTGIRTLTNNDIARTIQKIGLEEVASAIKHL